MSMPRGCSTMIIKFPDDFMQEIRTIITDRQDLLFEVYKSSVFSKVIDHFVKISDNLFCIICRYEHSDESHLRNCLQYHKILVSDYFIDHELVKVSSE